MESQVQLNPREKLKSLREQHGTQKTVASDLNITQTHLRELENGRSYPGTRLLKRMKHYFKVSDDELFPDLNDPKFYLRD